jgi:hypothetical protein
MADPEKVEKVESTDKQSLELHPNTGSNLVGKLMVLAVLSADSVISQTLTPFTSQLW